MKKTNIIATLILAMATFCPALVAETAVAPNTASTQQTSAIAEKATTTKAAVDATVSEIKEDAKKASETDSKKPETKKYKEVTSDLVMKIIFNLIGGLGIFLLGMKYMSEGLQTIAGSRLKSLIKMVTDNRIMAVGVGTAVTVLVQSSSVTTVMVVGFVNSGIMELSQAIGVILGANIGTTITGWIIALKIGKYGLPLLGAAAFFFIFSKKETQKYLALTVMGIGMVFFGLELMKNGFKPVKEVEAFYNAFQAFRADSYFGVLKCAAVGCILTVIVQSSSATLGITMALAATGVLEFETAAALVLGENIGTTITAMLASIGSTSNAKRAAYFHSLFNLIGVFWITLLFKPYMEFIHFIVGEFNDVLANFVKVKKTGELTEGVDSLIFMKIATTHTIFNIVNTLAFIPFTGVFSKFLTNVVKDTKGSKEQITDLNENLIESPFAAIEQCQHEVDKMVGSTKEMLVSLRKYISDGSLSRKEVNKVFEAENILDKVQAEITDFLTDVFSNTMSTEQAEDGRKLLMLADELESISDNIVQILKHFLRLEENGLQLSKEQQEQFIKLHDSISEYFDYVVSDTDNLEALYRKTLAEGDGITSDIRAYRAQHWERLSSEKMPPLMATTYVDIMGTYRKIKAIIVHIAETRSDQHS